MNRHDLLSFRLITQSVDEWALDYGITPETIMARLRAGKSLEYAITKPMRTKPGDRLPERKARRHRKPTLAPRCRRYGGDYPEHRLAIMVEYDSECHSLSEWCRRFRLARSTVGNRLRAGWTIHDALTRPSRSKLGRGVVSDLTASVGTGGGSTAQEGTNIGISE
ncbi:hypothetical protein NKJ87_17790 [Mesorhizobium sp. M0027]|uniref:hypothetical protein n=1 Tax=Mesorhizobium sp. M0027 TaxID=2956848 RepID=UPI00333A238F